MAQFRNSKKIRLELAFQPIGSQPVEHTLTCQTPLRFRRGHHGHMGIDMVALSLGGEHDHQLNVLNLGLGNEEPAVQFHRLAAHPEAHKPIGNVQKGLSRKSSSRILTPALAHLKLWR